jgi:localization factor PodJL
MKSRVPPSGYGTDPSASSSTRPAGMSLGQWLNAKVGKLEPESGPAMAQAGMSQPAVSQPAKSQPAMAQPAAAQPAMSQPMRASLASSGQDIAEIHRRLNSITDQINQLSPGRASAPATTAAAGSFANGSLANGSLANQLNDAISRLDSRLSRLSQRPAPPPPPATELPPPPAFAAPQPAADAFDIGSAVAEIAARRGELDGSTYRQRQPQPMMPASPPAPTLTSLERQLQQITSQMETLRRPDGLEQSIATFREELAEIRLSLTEALPRRAIDSLENEIRSLAQRIDRSREDGGDRDTLANIERALNDIYGAVRTLTPAEQLTGYDAAIRSLSDKIDLIVRAGPDNGVEQLQEAIAALRAIASNIATNEAIGHLADHLQALGQKIDRIAASGGGDMLSALEQRIAMLTNAMESRSQPAAADTSRIEAAVRALSDRIDHLGHGDGASSMAQIEQRVAHLLERFESTEPRFNNSSRVEEHLTEIMRHLEYQRQALAGIGESSAAAPQADQTGFVDSIRRELIDVRDSQVVSDRRTQDTLEAVHSTLSHVVDRLGMIEGDLRRVQPPAAQPVMPPQTPMARAPAAAYAAPAVAPVLADPAPHLRPELPNPVTLAQAPDLVPAMPADAGGLQAVSHSGEAAQASRSRGMPRAPIDSTLPPDFPLEPGARNQGKAGAPERAAGAEPSDPAAPADGGGKSNFIAAARRAAQAAAAANTEKPGKLAAATDAARSVATKAGLNIRTARQATTTDAAKPSRTRPLLVGVSVVLIVLSGFRLAMNFLDGGETATAEKPAVTAPAPDAAPPPAAMKQKSEAPPAANPLLTSPTAVQRQTLIAPTPATPAIPAEPATASTSAAVAPAAVAPVAPAQNDVTGSIASQPAASPAPAPTDDANLSADKLPDALAGPALRAAAMRGEPAASFEVAVRYAEGRGIAVNYGEAAKWYERAAQKGIVPAMFRLGTILEKGLNGKKDIDAARRYYVLAAERGNAKAMHNLAVLDADGGGKGPNYKSASVWFRKAADHGIADSQYNLGILYARGIGVEQNLAESFKWFSLAAAQGDADAARKRDDVSKRLDPQSQAAAKLAIQTFTPEPQPDDAINVAAPAGGWDAAPAAPKQAVKPGAKPTKQRAAAR